MKPRIIIVDEKDNVIGFKKMETLKREDIYRVSALWIVNGKGEILLARRAFNKSHHPGKWGPAVAGTVEEDETYDSNIVKEAEEELGLKNIKFNRGSKLRTSGKYNHFTQWYYFKTNKELDEFIVQEDEVAEIKWFNKKELFQDLEKNSGDFLYGMKRWVEMFS